MRKVAVVLLLLFFVTVYVNAQDFDIQEEKPKNMFIAVGLAGSYLGETFLGGRGAFGYYTSAKSYLSAELNAGGYSAGKIGGYSYTVTYYHPYHQDTYHDGKINYIYTTYDFLLSWNYLFSLSESDKTQLRIGASAGVLSITGEESYDPTEFDGEKIRGIPDTHSETQTTVAGGVNLGFIWNFHNRWFADFGYRLLANPGISFDERTIRIDNTDITIAKHEFDAIQHHVNITLGWRF
ncbi:MAG: hypothetical protein LBQ47_06195 [Endomicrobium sp.]|nr:hypothetical protein [Endomicrobium sp.]